MSTQRFALGIGFIYVVAGLLGFVPATVALPPTGAPELTITAGYGYVLGLFPVNVLHNLVHLGIGAWGLGTYRTFMNARTFCRGLAWLYGVLTIMGLFPGLNTTFGLIPIFGHDIWLHALTAAVAAYYGWSAPVAESGVVAEDVRRRA
jgi:hypothetical protein